MSAPDVTNQRLVTTTNTRSRISEALLFAGNFIRHPHMLGSIVPSSRYLVDRVLSRVDWHRARIIVEYGPGVGTFTREILRRMRSDARLVAIETNRHFVQFLKESVPDPRLHVVLESAENVSAVLENLGLAPAQYIVSGIPLGSMPVPVRAGIVEKTRAALDPSGAFLVYQFTARVLPQLRQSFAHVHRSFERRNVPPAQLFVCESATVPLRVREA